MEPRIQYAKTKDGVSIAYYALGEGEPLVVMPRMPWSHTQLEWQVPDMRLYYERLAEGRMLVRYDGRGVGLSDREPTDFSLDSQLLDLEAVVDRIGLAQFALFGVVYSGLAAIAYAQRHPDRASRLLLWCAAARGADFTQPPQLRALATLADQDWEVFTESATHYMFGYTDAVRAHQAAVFLRECASHEAYQAFASALSGTTVAPLLPQVKPSTLVVHRRQVPYPQLSSARELASQIPNARLAMLEGASQQPYQGDVDSVLAAIDDFLGEGEEVASGPKPLTAEDVLTILFTDIEGSTALTHRLGDAAARERLREHERTVRAALKAHGGSEVKTMGDGFMASFSSATKALECAIVMQRAFAEHNESAEEPIKVRVGLNAGEPIAEEEDLFGTAVNLAARICSRAEAGQILAPVVVRELAAGKPFLFADLGETELRGYEDPVRLFEVRWRD